MACSRCGSNDERIGDELRCEVCGCSFSRVGPVLQRMLRSQLQGFRFHFVGDLLQLPSIWSGLQQTAGGIVAVAELRLTNDTLFPGREAVTQLLVPLAALVAFSEEDSAPLQQVCAGFAAAVKKSAMEAPTEDKIVETIPEKKLILPD